MPAMNITVVGNLSHDPELRFTPTGVAVASFTVAHNERYRDNSGEWKDGATSFVRCHVWREPAERLAESTKTGDRVIVTGVLRARTYEAKDGSKRTAWEVQASEVAASMRYATVKITKATRDNAPIPEDPWAGEKPTAETDAAGATEPPPF